MGSSHMNLDYFNNSKFPSTYLISDINDDTFKLSIKKGKFKNTNYIETPLLGAMVYLLRDENILFF